LLGANADLSEGARGCCAVAEAAASERNPSPGKFANLQQ